MSKDPQNQPWWRWMIPLAVGTYLDEKIFVWIVLGCITLAIWAAKSWGGDGGMADYGTFAVLCAALASVTLFDLFQLVVGGSTRRSSPYAWMVFSPILLIAFLAGAHMHQSRLNEARDYEQRMREDDEQQRMMNNPDFKRGLELFSQYTRARAATTTTSTSKPATDP